MDETLRYRVEGMDCASCAAKIETALARLEGVDGVAVSATAGTLRLRAQPGVCGDAEAAVRALGVGLARAQLAACEVYGEGHPPSAQHLAPQPRRRWAGPLRRHDRPRRRRRRTSCPLPCRRARRREWDRRAVCRRDLQGRPRQGASVVFPIPLYREAALEVSGRAPPLRLAVQQREQHRLVVEAAHAEVAHHRLRLQRVLAPRAPAACLGLGLGLGIGLGLGLGLGFGLGLGLA